MCFVPQILHPCAHSVLLSPFTQWCFFMGMVVLASYIPNNTKPDPKYFRHATETPYTQ